MVHDDDGDDENDLDWYISFLAWVKVLRTPDSKYSTLGQLSEKMPT